MIISKPQIMGIVNVTPDSFSDGGDYNTVDQAIEHGLALLEQGADILDIGGESTRPNAEVVSVEEEIRRVVPVIEGLSKSAAKISIDTRNAETMQASIKAGATVVNDVSALRHDPNSIHVVAESGLPVCLMHMQGDPQSMQRDPSYGDVIQDICDFFEERLSFCEDHGISQARVILDPGIGFGKTLEHNLAIIKNIKAFKKFGCPVLLGTSRKSFIGKVSGEADAKERLGGSLSSALYGFAEGIDIFRVHDVREIKQAFDVYQAVLEA